MKFGLGSAEAQRRKLWLDAPRRPLRSTATTSIVLRPARRPETLIQTENCFWLLRLISLPSRNTLTLRIPDELWILSWALKP